MTLAAIVALSLGFGALLLYALAEAAFDAVFGYIGASAVWLLSFGRVRMDPLRGGESVLASRLGVIFTVLLALGICYFFQRP
jgi:hypothetical protein